MNETPPTFPPATGLVRRLAPIETCRLMGFPDDYLDVDGPATKDAPRYKACGNSWAVNCAEFVNARIERALRESGAVAPDAPIRYATTCSGVEAHSLSVGYTHANWQPRFFSEIEPFPCRVLAHRYPDVPNLGDMTKVDGTKWNVDVFSGGTPCFTAGNMVLTESGYRPIEDIRVGDRVMTHQGRLRRVSAVGKKMARNIVDVKCATAPRIRCTSDHKFWSPVNPHRDNRRHAPTYCKTIFDGMEFRSIADIGKGGFVARLREYELMMMPKIPFAYNATTKDIIELAGWYVGDGHCAGFSEKKHKKVLLLSLNAEKVAAFRARFADVINFTITPHSQGVLRVQVANAKLCDWLVANFGHHAQNKRIPAWLIAAEPELCNAFIDGYMATDGFRNKDYSFACSTTSLALALGLSDLVGTCAIYRSKVAPKKTMFDGRIVNQRDFWNVRRSANKALRFHVHDKWMNVRVSSIEKCAPETVYNITVEGDHGYIVNGVCVSNCQSVSVAGKRHGMAEGSGTRSSLAFHWLRIANETGAKVALWENVGGVFSANGGRDFTWFVHRLTEAGWGVAWRVLDAQYVFSWTFPRAIPQRRRRIWLVAARGGDWQMAARIMFERARESGATPPVRVLGDGTVVDAEDGEDAAERRFLRFGATREADWVSVRDLDEVSQFGNVLYRGPMFKCPDLFGGCEDATPDNIEPQMLAALNGGGGVAVGDIVALLKVPAWNAGIERPWALRDAEANPLPAAYDGTVCGLSDVLLPWSDDLLRLVLSQRACEGILRRAKARGKELKAVLKTALEGQIACWTAGLLRDAKGKGNAAEEAEAEEAEAATHEEEEETADE